MCQLGCTLYVKVQCIKHIGSSFGGDASSSKSFIKCYRYVSVHQFRIHPLPPPSNELDGGNTCSCIH